MQSFALPQEGAGRSVLGPSLRLFTCVRTVVHGIRLRRPCALSKKILNQNKESFSRKHENPALVSQHPLLALSHCRSVRAGAVYERLPLGFERSLLLLNYYRARYSTPSWRQTPSTRPAPCHCQLRTRNSRHNHATASFLHSQKAISHTGCTSPR